MKIFDVFRKKREMRVISVFNQKGGVGKTTTVVNLASALGFNRKKVLVIDIDPQGNSTSGLGVEDTDITIYDVLTHEKDINDTIQKTKSKNVDIIPANSDLCGLEIELLSVDKKEYLLQSEIGKIPTNYDFILIDCPPSLGVLSINALVSSQSVLIPIQCEYYALEGVSQLMNTVNLIRKGLNPDLEVEGVLLTMYDSRNNLSEDVKIETENYFKDKLFDTVIPRNIRLAEAPSFGESIIYYDKNSKGAIAYLSLAKELIKNRRK
ncbi:ParA family protein [Parvimonas sp. C2]|uniref:ParA family protein n=1 Tax=Parvimonas sp. C2 TaxID=3110692 RepID=UPI002B481707|nr:AAA family ATPase [Parvimonas sp. C2]MEB3073602.1 AAA family ATPase [Parvimonas sp. C2]